MRNIIILAVLITIMTSCSSSKPAVSSSGNNSADNPNISAVVWQQTAAEYEALCYQAFNFASARINNADVQKLYSTGKAPAIVLDLDETVLNNSPYNGSLIRNNSNYAADTWYNWSKKARAELIPGAKDFIYLAEEKGFAIYYISNRTEEELEVTLENLQALGIDAQMPQMFFKKDESSKTARRDFVKEEHDIFMFIGDNLADFDDIFEEKLTVTERKNAAYKMKDKFGKKFIVLPNVMYGDWEKTLKLDDTKYDSSTERTGILKWIKGF
ncbi:MAG: 5'-nucleotidase (lipoprotein e(P4) family) [Vicingaceae bacterium]|jgi:5'-nucleotidase (lipoprotein e(P4) family)